MPKTGRIPKNKEIYNREIKERFLNENYSNLGTIDRYRKLFLRTYEFENELNKDVYNFTLDEIKDMVVALSSASQATVASTVSILNKYIQWAIHQGFVNSVINVVGQYIDKDEIMKMISNLAQENRFLRSKQDLINILNLTENYQDKVCFVLAFHGLKADDILSIEIKDIDFEKNTITVNGKTITLEPYFIDIVRKAKDQTIYIKNNGFNIDRLRSPELKLDLNSKYLLRGVQSSQREEGGKMTPQMVNSRIKRVVESFGRTDDLLKTFKDNTSKIETAKDLHRQLISLITILYSGMFIKLHGLEEKTGKLDSEDFINIRKEYGLGIGNWNDTQKRYELWKENL